MNELPPSPAAQKAEEESHFAIRAFKLISYPVAVALGWWAACVSAHNKAYTQAKNLGMLDDIFQPLKPERDANLQALLNGTLDSTEHFRRSIEAKKAYQLTADARMRKIGLDKSGTLGFNSFMRKWKYMSQEHKPETVLVGLTVAGVAIGALLTMADSKALSHFFSRHFGQDEQKNK